MKSRLSLIVLGLAVVLLTSGMNGGCGEPISESVSYGNPNWMTDGRIVANKTVVREKQKGIIPGYMTYEKIFEAKYLVTMKDDGTDEKEIYGGEDKYGKMGEAVASPLGNYLGVWEYRDGKYCITIITADGSKEIKSIDCGEMINSFDWSPDETRIAYAGEVSRDLYVLNISDESKVKIATSAEAVAWRVGEKIAYISTTYIEGWGNYPSKLTLIKENGTNKMEMIDARDPQITNANEIIYRGASIESSAKIDSIRKINIDGTNDRYLFKYDKYKPRLSFDNTKIVGGGGVWVVNIDGTNLKKLRD